MLSTIKCGGWRVGIAACALALSASFAMAQTTYRLLRVVDNTITDPLARPVGLTYAPGDFKRVFVWQKGGKIRVIDTTTNPLPTVGSSTTPFLSITVTGNTSASDERGLLGMAFHPQYQTNGKFYVNYTISISSQLYTRVSEFTNRNPSTLVPTPGSNVADPASERVLAQFTQPQSNHKGSWVGFGPDGYLYWTQGDGGGQQDGLDGSTGHNAGTGNGQYLGTLLGKILRIDVNGAGVAPEGGVTGPNPGAYTVPADNPFVSVAGAKDEIWAYGLRNPWRCSFDRLTGDLWIGDVGQDSWEEIDYQPAITLANQTTVRGRNYGWRCYEGTVLYSTSPNTTGCPSGYDSGGATGPVGIYSHGQAIPNPEPARLLTGITGCSVVGGYVYRGCAIADLYGLYVFTDYCSGRIYAPTLNTALGELNDPSELASLWIGSTAVTPNIPVYTRPATALVSFGEDAYGELYVLDELSNRIYKFVSIASGHVPLANTDASRDGVVTIDDIFVYLNYWFASATQADYDRSGSVTIDDIFVYLNGWFRGSCPF